MDPRVDLAHLGTATLPDRFDEMAHKRRKETAKATFAELIDKINLESKVYKCNQAESAWEMDMHILSRCQRYLEAFRTSPYYFELHERVENNEELLDKELYCYIVTADDVKTIPPALLERADKRWGDTKEGANIRILKLLTDLKNPNNADSEQQKAQLRNLLTVTLRSGLSGTRFVNLRGFDFTGMDLSDVTFRFCDLSHACLSQTRLNNTRICVSTARGIDLTDINDNTENSKFNLDFTQSNLNGARFGTITKPKVRLFNCEVYNANFANTDGVNISLYLCKLDYSSFSNTLLANTNNDIDPKLTFKGCNFINSSLIGVFFCTDDTGGIKVLDPSDCFSAESLKSALDDIQIRFGTPDGAQGEPQTDRARQHRTALQTIIANNIIDAIKQDKGPHHRLELINAAIDHSLFQPESAWEQNVNHAYKNANDFFGMFCRKPDTHSYYSNPGLTLLEDERNSIASELGRKHQLMQ